ncbi:hypothetical protein H9P43_000107 [Blastocladiella emersonii ATCC 22665]|nr:hypothetical protein H9P43_000107 [Blastocladiella emersonii ATCC 22665]
MQSATYLFCERHALLSELAQPASSAPAPPPPRLFDGEPVPELVDPLVTLHGFQLYCVEQWVSDPSRVLHSVVVNTGDDRHEVRACAVRFPDLGASAFVGRVASRADEHHLQPTATPHGTLYTASLALLDPELNLIPIPDGDLDRHLTTVRLNVNLRRLGCGTRAAVSARPPTDAQAERFLQAFKILRRAPLETCVAEMVDVFRTSLVLLGYVPPGGVPLSPTDGFLCDRTMDVVRELKSAAAASTPVDGPAGAAAASNAAPGVPGAPSTTVAADVVCDLPLVISVVTRLIHLRTKLSMLVKDVVKDPYSDPALFQKKIASFQKSKQLAVTRVFDADTTTVLEMTLAQNAAGSSRIAKLLRTRLDQLDASPSLDNFLTLTNQVERTRALWHGSAKKRIDGLLLDPEAPVNKVEGLIQGGREFATTLLKGVGSGVRDRRPSSPFDDDVEMLVPPSLGSTAAASSAVNLGGAVGSAGTTSMSTASNLTANTGTRLGRRSAGKKRGNSGNALGLTPTDGAAARNPAVSPSLDPAALGGGDLGHESDAEPKRAVIDIATSFLRRREKHDAAAPVDDPTSPPSHPERMRSTSPPPAPPVSTPATKSKRKHGRSARKAAKQAGAAVTDTASSFLRSALPAQLGFATSGTGRGRSRSPRSGTRLLINPAAAAAPGGSGDMRTPTSTPTPMRILPPPSVHASTTTLGVLGGGGGAPSGLGGHVASTDHLGDPASASWIPLPPRPTLLDTLRSEVQAQARRRRAVSLPRLAAHTDPVDDIYTRRRALSVSLAEPCTAGMYLRSRLARRARFALADDLHAVRARVYQLVQYQQYAHAVLDDVEAGAARELARDVAALRDAYQVRAMEVEMLRSRIISLKAHGARVAESVDDMATQALRIQYTIQTTADKLRESDEIVSMMKEGLEGVQVQRGMQVEDTEGIASRTRRAVMAIPDVLFLVGVAFLSQLSFMIRWLDTHVGGRAAAARPALAPSANAGR